MSVHHTHACYNSDYLACNVHVLSHRVLHLVRQGICLITANGTVNKIDMVSAFGAFMIKNGQWTIPSWHEEFHDRGSGGCAEAQEQPESWA